MFKTGDRVRLKSEITQTDLKNIAITDAPSKLQNGIFSKFKGNTYFNKDVAVYFFGKDRCEYLLPQAWIERIEPRGHHLTKIFK